MKKVLSLILALVLCLSLCACGEPSVSIDEEIQLVIQAKASSYCKVSFNDVKNVSVSVTDTQPYLIEHGIDDEYEKYYVYGYVIVTDVYGDQYKAKFSANVYFDEERNGECREFEMDTPTKK